MENLVIEATSKTPDVFLSGDGNLSINGKMYDEDSLGFFTPIIEWIEKFNAAKVNFDIKLDYLNTSGSKMLFTMLRIMDENCEIGEINIKWHYEMDDEDHLEVGEYFQESLTRTKFEFLGIEVSKNAAA